MTVQRARLAWLDRELERMSRKAAWSMHQEAGDGAGRVEAAIVTFFGSLVGGDGRASCPDRDGIAGLVKGPDRAYDTK